MLKKIFFTYLFFCLATNLLAQKVNSSCTSHDSIISRYKTDADRLALRMTFKVGSSFVDSATISKSLSDSILRALIAVYNADSLRARDTVVFMRKISSFPTPVMNNFYMAADSTLPWMQQLRIDSLKIGNDSIGNIIRTYNLKVARYYRINQFPYHIAIFESKGNLNMDAITPLVNKLGGVYFANKGKVEGDGNDISVIKTKNFIELTYSYGWDNCPSGCRNRRYWKFNVYPNCSVEFLGSSGTKWDPSSINKIAVDFIKPSPNPFQSQIILTNLNCAYKYSLMDEKGQRVRAGMQIDPKISNLENLAPGLYFLEIITDNAVKRFKVIKE